MNMSKASLAKNPSEVAAMFDRVAAKYDITNDVLAFGLTHSWRRATAQAVSAKKGDVVLDLAAGTGTSSIAFSKYGIAAVKFLALTYMLPIFMFAVGEVGSYSCARL